MTPEQGCKSPAHKQYREALEGLYIQTWMASRDLAKLIDEGDEAWPTRASSLEKGTALARVQHKIEDVEQRLAFGRQQLADAEVVINRHFDRGCRNVPQEVSR